MPDDPKAPLPTIDRALRLIGPFVALQALGLLALAVLFNLILFVLFGELTRKHIIGGGSFPALVLFLSFAISIGIILINGLGEQISTTNIDNPWIKKIGVTPIMVIVAVLIATFASFAPAAEQIFPSSHLEFMLARVGLTCQPSNRSKARQATGMLIVFSANDEKYVKDLRAFFEDKKSKSFALIGAQRQDLQVVQKDAKDESYRLLMQYADESDRSLSDDLRTSEQWIAYTVKASPPNRTTSFPIPTRFEKKHKTRLFVIVNQSPVTEQPELSSLNDVARKDLWPLFQVEIDPSRPQDELLQTDLDLQVFAHPEHICWYIGA
jgi:hypothetical protein